MKPTNSKWLPPLSSRDRDGRSTSIWLSFLSTINNISHRDSQFCSSSGIRIDVRLSDHSFIDSLRLGPRIWPQDGRTLRTFDWQVDDHRFLNGRFRFRLLLKTYWWMNEAGAKMSSHGEFIKRQLFDLIMRVFDVATWQHVATNHSKLNVTGIHCPSITTLAVLSWIHSITFDFNFTTKGHLLNNRNPTTTIDLLVAD